MQTHGLPPWSELERGGSIDVNRLVATPGIRMGARMMGAALPASVPGGCKIAADSALGRQLRAQYDRTALLLESLSTANAESELMERLRPKPGECPSLEPPAVASQETPEELRARLRRTIASKRSQRTAAAKSK